MEYEISDRPDQVHPNPTIVHDAPPPKVAVKERKAMIIPEEEPAH